jgi:DNA-binding transcriptional MerR regulator
MNVAEFSKRVGLSPHTIRYYDKIGLLSQVHRRPNGHRVFSEKDIKWIEFVQRLKETGMSLEHILSYATLREQGDTTLLARREILIDHSKALKTSIAAQLLHLERLNDKIDLYTSALEGKITLD